MYCRRLQTSLRGSQQAPQREGRSQEKGIKEQGSPSPRKMKSMWTCEMECQWCGHKEHAFSSKTHRSKIRAMDAPQLTRGLCPNNPPVSWKLCKSKMYWICLTHRTSQLSVGSEHLYQPIDGQLSWGSLQRGYLPLLTRSRGHRWAFCRQDTMRKRKTQSPNTAGNMGPCRVPGAGCQLSGWRGWTGAVPTAPALSQGEYRSVCH